MQGCVSECCEHGCVATAAHSTHPLVCAGLQDCRGPAHSVSTEACSQPASAHLTVGPRDIQLKLMLAIACTHSTRSQHSTAQRDTR